MEQIYFSTNYLDTNIFHFHFDYIVNTSIILTAAHCLCNIGPVGSDNLIREELVPCRVNKRNPKEIRDYANQQFTVDKFNAKITKLITKFFFIVGENQIDNGLRGTTEETAELLTSFENNRKAGTVENAIAMELTKSGNEIFRGYDIGLIQMVLDAYCAMIKMPRGHISQYDDNKNYNWNNLYLFSQYQFQLSE